LFVLGTALLETTAAEGMWLLGKLDMLTMCAGGTVAVGVVLLTEDISKQTTLTRAASTSVVLTRISFISDSHVVYSR
jgi:hypothetical protein